MNILLKSKLKQTQRLHDMAMDAAEKALLADKPNVDLSREAYRQAFEYEREAANLLTDDTAFEPSRSVLHRSAAALALECGEWRAAKQLICAALAGTPGRYCGRTPRIASAGVCNAHPCYCRLMYRKTFR